MITLKAVLRANAASCIIFAAIFLLKPAGVASFLGGDTPAPEAVLLILGAILMFNGGHLLWASFKALPSKLLVLYFTAGDFLWVLASLGLVTMELWVTTEPGALATTLVAALIAVFGVLQIVKLRTLGQG